MADDRTQFLIELAAKFSGGESAVATVATLGDRMLVAGATAKDFEEATSATSAALEDAAAAALSAAGAVAAGEKSYASAETAADRAAKMVELLGTRAQELTGKLQAALDAGDGKSIARVEKQIWTLAERQQEAVVKANAAAAALKGEASALDLLSSKAATAAAKHDDLKAGLGNVKAAADKAAKAAAAASGTGKVNEMAEAMGKLGGPAGVAGQKLLGVATGFSKMKGAMGAAGPYVAIAVAIIAIATAAVVAAVGIAKWGVSLADTNRTASLLSAGIARSVEGGAALDATIAKLGGTVPQTADELRSMAGDLAKTGLRGKALTDALEDAAVSAAELKFGPDFAKQMLSLDVQSRRFSANLAGTFGGLKIEGLLGGMSTLGALFDSSTSSGKAMKFLFEALFQPLIDGVTAAIPKIERMFLYAEILALKAYIALKPYHSQIKAVGMAFLEAGAVIALIFGAAIAVVIALVVAAVAAFGALLFAVLHPIEAFEALRDGVISILDGLVAWFQEVGPRMIEGLINGIKSGGTAVINALTGVVQGGIDAVTNLLQLGSPSKLLFGMGGDTAEGFTGGVEGGASDAQGALEAMVAPPAAGAGGAPGGGGGGISVSIGQIVVSGENGKERALDLIDQFTAWLEGEGITIGGGEVPA